MEKAEDVDIANLSAMENLSIKTSVKVILAVVLKQRKKSILIALCIMYSLGNENKGSN